MRGCDGVTFNRTYVVPCMKQILTVLFLFSAALLPAQTYPCLSLNNEPFMFSVTLSGKHDTEMSGEFTQSIGVTLRKTNRQQYDSLKHLSACATKAPRHEKISACTLELFEIDTATRIHKIFCSSAEDSIVLMKAKVKLQITYGTNKKQEFYFTAYVPSENPAAYIQTFNAYNAGLADLFHFECCGIGQLILRYHDFDYRCDVTSPYFFFYFPWDS
jgi:hypothetical protein